VGVIVNGNSKADRKYQEEDEKSQSILQAKKWKLKDALNHFMGDVWEAINPKIPLVWQEMVSYTGTSLFASTQK
jgi:hypothetical protein